MGFKSVDANVCEVHNYNVILANQIFQFSKIFGWGAFALGIAGTTNSNWSSNAQNQTMIGLWHFCVYDGSKDMDCATLDREAWIDACRAFMVLFVIFTFFAGTSAEQKPSSKKARQHSANCSSLSGHFGTIALSVFSALAPSSYPDYTRSTGFILAAVATGLSYAAGCLKHLSASRMPEDPPTVAHNCQQPHQNSFNSQEMEGNKFGINPTQPPPIYVPQNNTNVVRTF